MINHPSYQYALNAYNGNIEAPKYVKLQCKIFLDICEDKSEKYKINLKN